MSSQYSDHDIRSSEDLSRACSQANFAQAESLARRFVARHPADVGGWFVLLACVERNANAAEMERLARLALARFPGVDVFRLSLFNALLRSMQMDAAASLLYGSQRGGHTLTIEEATILAEIELGRNPQAAQRLYAKISAQVPSHPLAKLCVKGAEPLKLPVRHEAAVGFMLVAPWHAWILRPIADALGGEGVPYFFSANVWIMKVLQPAVVVIADPLPGLMSTLRLMLPKARFVNTHHGIALQRKNYSIYAAAVCDYTCECAERISDEICNMGLLPPERVWVTGYPQMDGLFRRLATTPEIKGMANAPRSVMFAPTFDRDLSAAFLIGEDPITTLRGDDVSIRVILTGHPALQRHAPELMAKWRRLAAASQNAEYFDSSMVNVADRLPDAGVLVSDVSSVVLQFLALDRPFVRLFNSTQERSNSGYFTTPDDWEPQIAHATVTDSACLSASVFKALEGPEPQEVRVNRRRLMDQYFGDLTDGRAGERIAEHVMKIRSQDKP